MKTILPLISFLILAACASSSSFYQPAEGPGAYGYSEVQLTDSRYRVSFTGDSGTSETAVKDMALLRAAELTLMQNYDWFRIESQQTQQSNRAVPSTTTIVNEGEEVVRECGPLGCTTTVTPAYTGTQVVTTRSDDRYAVTFEIVMGRGEVANPTTIYNAHELYENLEDMYD